MKRDFKNSVILGYGPTGETHCGACEGNHRQPLKKGFAFHCHDNTSDLDFVAGSECRGKIEQDTRTLSAIPHFGAAKPAVEKTGKPGKGGNTSADFTRASTEGKLIADMSAWVQLRQKRLPELGFNKVSWNGLAGFQTAIAGGLFTIDHARAVQKIYDSAIRKQPGWELENLQKCHDIAMQIARVEANPATSDSNRDFLASIKKRLTNEYYLSEGQIQGLNNIVEYRGEPEWTRNLKFR